MPLVAHMQLAGSNARRHRLYRRRTPRLLAGTCAWCAGGFMPGGCMDEMTAKFMPSFVSDCEVGARVWQPWRPIMDQRSPLVFGACISDGWAGWRRGQPSATPPLHIRRWARSATPEGCPLWVAWIWKLVLRLQRDDDWKTAKAYLAWQDARITNIVF